MSSNDERNIFLVFMIQIVLKGYVNTKRVGSLVGIPGFEIGFGVVARIRCDDKGVGYVGKDSCAGEYLVYPFRGEGVPQRDVLAADKPGIFPQVIRGLRILAYKSRRVFAVRVFARPAFRNLFHHVLPVQDEADIGNREFSAGSVVDDTVEHAIEEDIQVETLVFEGIA